MRLYGRDPAQLSGGREERGQPGAHKRSTCKKDASITGTTIDRSWRWGQVRHRRGVNPVDPPCTSSCPCGRITIANALSQAIDRGLCAGAMTAAHMGGASIEAPSVASPLSHRVAMFSGTRCMVLPPVKDAMIGWECCGCGCDRWEFRSQKNATSKSD